MGKSEYQITVEERARNAGQRAEDDVAVARHQAAVARAARWAALVPAPEEMALEGAAKRLAHVWAACQAQRRDEGSLGGGADVIVAGAAAEGEPDADPAPASAPSDFRLFLAGSGNVSALGSFIINAGGIRLQHGTITPGYTPGYAALLPANLSSWPVPLYICDEPKSFSVRAVASRGALRMHLHAATDAWLDEQSGWKKGECPYALGAPRPKYQGTLSLLAWDCVTASLHPGTASRDKFEVAAKLRSDTDAIVDALLAKLLAEEPALRRCASDDDEVVFPLLLEQQPATAEGYAATVACLAGLHVDPRRHAWCRVELHGPVMAARHMQAHVPAGSRAWLALAPHNDEVEVLDGADDSACMPRKLEAVRNHASALMLVQGQRTKDSIAFLRAILPQCASAGAQVAFVNGVDEAKTRAAAAGLIPELLAVARAFADGTPGLSSAGRDALRELRIRLILPERLDFERALNAGQVVDAQKAERSRVAHLMGFLCCLTQAAELTDVRALRRNAEAEREACAQVVHLPREASDRLLAFCKNRPPSSVREAANQRGIITSNITPVVGSDTAVFQRWEAHWSAATAATIHAALEAQVKKSRAALEHAGMGSAAADRLQREVNAVTKVYISAAEAAWDGFVRSYVDAGVAALAVPSAELRPEVFEWLNNQAAMWLDGRAEGTSGMGDRLSCSTNLFRAFAPRESRDYRAANPLLRWTSEPWAANPQSLVNQAGLENKLNVVRLRKRNAVTVFDEMLAMPGGAIMVRLLTMLGRRYDDLLEPPPALRTKLNAALLEAHKARGESIQRAQEQRQATMRICEDGKQIMGVICFTSAAAPLEPARLSEQNVYTEEQAELRLRTAVPPLPLRYLEHMPFCRVFVRGKKHRETELLKVFPKKDFHEALARACSVSESEFLSPVFAGERQLAKFVECCDAFIKHTDEREKHAGLALLRDSGRVPPLQADAARSSGSRRNKRTTRE